MYKRNKNRFFTGAGNNLIKNAFDLEKKEERMIQRYTEKVDENWSLKNNKPSYISMVNPSALNKITKNISIFDIMTLTSLFGVYNEIDWKKIHQDSNNLDAKQELMLKTHSESQ